MASKQNKPRIGVVLTAEARKALRSEPIIPSAERTTRFDHVPRGSNPSR